MIPDDHVDYVDYNNLVATKFSGNPVYIFFFHESCLKSNISKVCFSLLKNYEKPYLVKLNSTNISN